MADGAAREAVRALRARGHRVSHVTLYTLWPIAEGTLLRAATAAVERVIVPELNIGLYADELRRVLRHPRIESLTRYDGGLISPQAIIEAVEAGAHREASLCRS